MSDIDHDEPDDDLFWPPDPPRRRPIPRVGRMPFRRALTGHLLRGLGFTAQEAAFVVGLRECDLIGQPTLKGGG